MPNARRCSDFELGLLTVVKCRDIILLTVMTPLTMKITHLYSVFRECLSLSWHALIVFKICIIETKRILLLLTIKIFKDDGNLLANVTFHTKLLNWSGSMSESQQGPEICDVISAKRYLCVPSRKREKPRLFIRVSFISFIWAESELCHFGKKIRVSYNRF